MEKHYGQAYARYENGILEVGTGRFRRKWKFQTGGFSTVELNGRAYPVSRGCDYDIFGLTRNSECILHSVYAYTEEDIYTSGRLEVVAVTHYPALHISARYVIWAYPGAPGLRTQLYVKAMGGYTPLAEYGESTAESFSLPAGISRIKAAGYYNDTQNRNTGETEILREESWEDGFPADIGWANLIAVFEAGGQGVCLVKESNKCVNQSAYDTGGFIIGEGTLRVTGIGIKPGDLVFERYLFAWAAWTVAFESAEGGLELALKEYDRCRFPLDEARDIYIMSNMWGSTGSAPKGGHGCDAAREDLVLRDLAAAGEIGVDVVQVDAGWNSAMGQKETLPDLIWHTHKEKYPEGWGKVKDTAEALGVTLGLWCSWLTPGDEIIENIRQGGFRYIKIDYAGLNTRQKFDYLYDKAVKIYEFGRGDVRINWDVTERAPRMGYYFGREFGNIYLANRKPDIPEKVIYVPYLVLRDAWQLAKYVNLNKFQISLQNLDMVNRMSNAHLHSYTYCAMIAFMGAPLFFQQLQYLSQQAREELKNVIGVYKRHRKAMYGSIVFPIGDLPSDNSWTGFQFVHESGGYIVLFRELNNTEEKKSVRLKFLNGRQLKVTDVFSGEEKTFAADAQGYVEFSIDKPCGVAWYRY